MKATRGKVHGPVAFGLPLLVWTLRSVPLAEPMQVEDAQARLQATETMSGFLNTWREDRAVDIGFLSDLDGKTHFHATHILDADLFFFSAPDAWPRDAPPGAPVPLAELRAWI